MATVSSEDSGHNQFYYEHNGYIPTKTVIKEHCRQQYEAIQHKPLEMYGNDLLQPKNSDILVVTWNVNEHALTTYDVEQFFTEKLKSIQPKIFVMALQEVDKPKFNFLSDSVQDSLLYSKNVVRGFGAMRSSHVPPPLAKNKDTDIQVLTDFFLQHEYTVAPNGAVKDSNQVLFVAYKQSNIVDMNIMSTVLTSNYISTKGSLAVSCTFNTTWDDNRKQVCFVSAHLSARSDVDQSKHPVDKKYFQRRIDELYDTLHKCDAWYKGKHNVIDDRFMPFNVILAGDLNFRMIKNRPSQDYDEGQLVLDSFDFHEMQKGFRQTYRVNKASKNELGECEYGSAHARSYAELGSKRLSAWTDRISFHNPLNSLTWISQESYGILDQHEGPSDHLPVFSTFDMHDDHPVARHTGTHKKW